MHVNVHVHFSKGIGGKFPKGLAVGLGSLVKKEILF